ncbi:MAG: molecular chaperone DnaJ [Dehalococcoidia bacterium]|nr:molecular chaperone DnaJ [Dehalococcoidia bacterium]
MTNKRDYYDILGIQRSASEEEVRKAFRRLALEYHPDRNESADAEGRFKEINEAYQALSDPEKRAAYNRFGHAGVSANGGSRGFEGVDTFGGFGDIFDAFFGGFERRARSEPRPGRDMEAGLTIAFEEAVLGTRQEVEISRVEVCERCKGNRAEPGTAVKECPTCRGRGEVRRSQQSLFGHFVQIAACPTCAGEGRVASQPCGRCRGSGQERRTRKIPVAVPAGVEDGMRIRLDGEGEAGSPGAPAGDLFLVIHVKEHRLFRRDGEHLLFELPINFAQAALGDTVEVPTLQGKTTLTIPAGAQSGALLRIKGEGVPHLQAKGRGDLLVTLRVVTPQSLDPEARRLLEELARRLEAVDGDDGDKRWFERIKGAFSGGQP